MMSAGINLVMTVIGFAVCTMFIVFVCTRLICARIQLSASRRGFPTASRSDLSILERGLHGLEPMVVASFPTKKFGDQFFSSGQDTQCTVCLAEYQEKDVLRILPYCGHSFHVTCIDMWLKQHSTCPVCRISLRDSPDGKGKMQPTHGAVVRSFNPPECFEPESSHFPPDEHGYPSRATQSQQMESSQEDQFISEPSRAQDMISIIADVNCSVKIASCHQSKGKHLESPSNS